MTGVPSGGLPFSDRDRQKWGSLEDHPFLTGDCVCLGRGQEVGGEAVQGNGLLEGPISPAQGLFVARAGFGPQQLPTLADCLSRAGVGRKGAPVPALAPPPPPTPSRVCQKLFQHRRKYLIR